MWCGDNTPLGGGANSACLPNLFTDSNRSVHRSGPGGRLRQNASSDTSHCLLHSLPSAAVLCCVSTVDIQQCNLWWLHQHCTDTSSLLTDFPPPAPFTHPKNKCFADAGNTFIRNLFPVKTTKKFTEFCSDGQFTFTSAVQSHFCPRARDPPIWLPAVLLHLEALYSLCTIWEGIGFLGNWSTNVG